MLQATHHVRNINRMFSLAFSGCWFLMIAPIFLFRTSSALYAYEILTLGDSITRGSIYVEGDGAGRQIGPTQGFLEEFLSDEGLPSRVYNWGISGETTFGGLNRINNVLNSRYADFILIMEGANDLYEGISSSTTTENIRAMISRSNAKNVTPIIGSITPNDRTAGFDSKIANDYNPKIAQMTKNENTRLANQYEALIPNWAGTTYDGLHPDLKGHSIIAKTWFDSIIRRDIFLSPILLLLLDE